MKVKIYVKTRSKKEGVELLPDGTLVVRVSAPPVEGKANERIVELVAKYYDIPKSKVKIAKGQASKHKTLEIER